MCYCGRGQAKGKRDRSRGTEREREGKHLFRIPCAIRHVPCAGCEEVTLRPRVPHPLPPADRCAEHGLQEYGPAADKGHTEEPSNLVHTEYTCRHWEKQTLSNQICTSNLHTSVVFYDRLRATAITCIVCVQKHNEIIRKHV